MSRKNPFKFDASVTPNTVPYREIEERQPNVEQILTGTGTFCCYCSSLPKGFYFRIFTSVIRICIRGGLLICGSGFQTLQKILN